MHSCEKWITHFIFNTFLNTSRANKKIMNIMNPIRITGTERVNRINNISTKFIIG